MPEITIRPATMDDAERLHAWRNDELTRRNSGSTGKVALEDHRRWLSATLASDRRRLCILEVDGVPAATCRFDYEDFGGPIPTEFSFSIAPEFRGKGLSKALCLVAVEAEPSHFSRVRPENVAIQRLLEAAGCRHVGEDRGFQMWHYGEPAVQLVR
jgi:RimJ/RimL family protein N-acetyltransferase